MNQNAEQFIDFRTRLHASFDQRANATMELGIWKKTIYP